MVFDKNIFDIFHVFTFSGMTHILLFWHVRHVTVPTPPRKVSVGLGASASRCIDQFVADAFERRFNLYYLSLNYQLTRSKQGRHLSMTAGARARCELRSYPCPTTSAQSTDTDRWPVWSFNILPVHESLIEQESYLQSRETVKQHFCL